MTGLPDAPVVVIEYADFQCPYCKRFWETSWPELNEQYVETGRVAFAFKHLPLERLHPAAYRAAQGGVCAHGQGRFWDYHAAALNAPRLDALTVLGFGASLGLDEPRYSTCLQVESDPAVDADIAEAEALAITSTPTFLIGHRRGDAVVIGQRLDGAQPVSAFVRAIDRLLLQGD